MKGSTQKIKNHVAFYSSEIFKYNNVDDDIGAWLVSVASVVGVVDVFLAYFHYLL